MQQTLWQQGVELMLYGMGTVFVFLIILIAMTSIMSVLIQRYVKPEPIATPRNTVMPASGNDDQLMAVISAAVHKYRSRRK